MACGMKPQEIQERTVAKANELSNEQREQSSHDAEKTKAGVQVLSKQKGFGKYPILSGRTPEVRTKVKQTSLKKV